MRGNNRVGVLLWAALGLISSFLMVSCPNVLAATPIVDTTGFITSSGIYQSPAGDFDLLILREEFSAAPLDLTAFDNPDPSGTTIEQNPSTFCKTPPADCGQDFMQSILVRMYNGGGSGTTYTHGFVARIGFTDGPSSNIKILGVLTDVDQNPATRLNNSDDIFQSIAVSEILDNAPNRGLEPSSGDWHVADRIVIQPDRKSVVIFINNQIDADDFRIILDYGDGLTTFPDGVGMYVNIVDQMTSTETYVRDRGVQIGDSDYGEVVRLLDIPLTSNTSPQGTAPNRLPDADYLTNTRAVGNYKDVGGDDDNTTIIYFTVDPAIADGGTNPDFYIWLFDGGLDANTTLSGRDDISFRTAGGDSLFEYILYGGPGYAAFNDDIAGANVPDLYGNSDPTDDFVGTLIDINSTGSRSTLRTDLDTGVLLDQNWTILPIDIDSTPGYEITPSPSDTVLAELFGVGRQVYKLVVDGRNVRNIGTKSEQTDLNRFQVDVSTLYTTTNREDCSRIKPINNCVIAWAYELTMAGRPLVLLDQRTNTRIYVPASTARTLDIQTLDLDEITFNPQDRKPAVNSVLTRPDNFQYGEEQTFESGDQVVIWGGSYAWTSINQAERNPTTETSWPVPGRDAVTCSDNPALCYDTTGNEDNLWGFSVDPIESQNPFALRAYSNGNPIPLLPIPPGVQVVPPCPDTDGDYICDDGDSSGTAGDNPCRGGYTANCDDNCLRVQNTDQADSDGDGVGYVCDNCKYVPNGPSEALIVGVGNQLNSDGDALGDACDNCGFVDNLDQADSDKCQPSNDPYDPVPSCTLDAPLPDGVGDVCDKCASVYNPLQNETDGDSIGDACDNCPGLGETCYKPVGSCVNPDQNDYDQDGYGDVCDSDCASSGDPLSDPDGDSIINCYDNCDNTPNPLQTDVDGDGVGDDCDTCTPTRCDKCGPGDIFNPGVFQLNSDGDIYGDICDSCPLDTNTGSDTDGDGTDDACDPCPFDPLDNCTVCSDDEVEIKITPRTLKRTSEGNPITVAIEFGGDNCHTPNDVVPSSFNAVMKFPVDAPAGCPEELSYQPPISFGANKIHVKFDRSIVEFCVDPGEEIWLEVSGQFSDGHSFEGTDHIRVIR